MKDLFAVRKLVELIFVKECKVTPEMTVQDSSFPPCLVTNDFANKLRHVFFVRKSIIYMKWSANFDVFYERDVLSDHETYLATIILKSLKEYKCQSNVFESFISVCSCVDFYSRETSLHAGLNYCELNTDIVMEIYESVLRKTFLRRNGFNRLVEYISTHKYLAWDLELVKNVLHEDTLDPLVEKMEKRIVKEINMEDKTGHLFDFELDALKTSAAVMADKVLSTTSVKLPTFSSDQDSKETASESSLNNESKLLAPTESMTQEVLSTTSVELPILPSDHDSNQMVTTSRLSKKTKAVTGKGAIEADLKFEPVETSQGSSSPYAKTHIEAKQPETIAWYESVVQAVVKYNQSETAGLVSSDNSIQKIADEILEDLKDKIQSLIALLDEYNEE